MSNDKMANDIAQVFDRDEALEHIMDDEEIFEEMIEIFINIYSEQMESISHAIESRDPEALRFSAHTFKGALGNFCAQNAYEIAFALERMGQVDDLADSEETFGRLRTEVSRLVTALQSSRRSVVR